ncbi:MAG: CHAT domain-containing protein [Steroidobacteraceae bacterium]
MAVRERGISVAAVLDVGTARASVTSASPIDRLGTISLAADLAPRDVVPTAPVSVRILSVDSRVLQGDVCVSAELIAPPADALARAQRLVAAADQKTGQRQWQNAFDRYLAAARLFDALGMADSAAAARHAMAELEYSHLRRERDSAALVATTLSALKTRRPELYGESLVLVAKDALLQASTAFVWKSSTYDLLSSAAAALRNTPAGARELPRIQILVGFLNYRTGRLAAARAQFDSAAATCRTMKDSECFARARQNLAVLAEEQQNYSAALADYTSALQTLDVSRMPRLFADVSDNIGRLEGRVGLIRRSEQSARTAIRLYAQLGECDDARRTIASLGEMLVRIGSIGEAESYLRQGATLRCGELIAEYRQLQDADHPADTTSYFDPLRHRVQDTICRDALAPDELTLDGNDAVFHALLATAEMQRLEDRFDDARSCLVIAAPHAIDPRSKVRLANESGELQSSERHGSAARLAFDDALRLETETHIANTSEIFGTTELGLAEAAMDSGRPEQAWIRVSSALRLGTARGDVEQMVSSLRIVAELKQKAGYAADAIRVLQCAIRLIEQVPVGELDPETRAIYMATQHAVFAQLTWLLAERSMSNATNAQAAWDAFAVSDEGHARSLRYALDQTTNERSSERTSSDIGSYRALLRRLASLATSTAHSSESGDFPDRLARLQLPRSPYEVALQPRLLARRLADLHADLVEFAVGQTDMFAFVVDSQGSHVVDLGDSEMIDHAAIDLATQLRATEPDSARIHAAARQLSRLVLWPIARFLSEKRLLVVPDDALHTVPFAVLEWPGGTSGQLVIQRDDVSVLPSALFLEHGAGSDSSATSSLRITLIGDPVFRKNLWERTCALEQAATVTAGEQPRFAWVRLLPSLPGSRKEVLDIAGIVRDSRPSASIRTLLGCSANSDAVRRFAPEATVLHIATHGLVDAQRPRLSALALTPESGSEDDGAFRLLDILSLRLRARMVVLSACDTSGGRLLPGEGVLGLAQAFLQAGAQSVITTYWRVEDGATVPFIDRFYRHLLLEHLSVGAALRATQLEFATKGGYAWAAFGVYGRPDTVL